MHHRKLLLPIATLAIVACAAPESDAAMEEAPAAAAPDPAADLAAIAAVRDGYQSAFNTGNAAGVAAYFAADAHDMENGMATMVGASGVEAGLTAMMAEMNAQIEIMTQKTDVSGDLAYDRGTYRMTMTPKAAGGTPMTEEGRYLVVLKRQPDNSWKIVEGMGNLPTPPAGAPMP